MELVTECESEQVTMPPAITTVSAMFRVDEAYRPQLLQSTLVFFLTLCSEGSSIIDQSLLRLSLEIHALNNRDKCIRNVLPGCFIPMWTGVVSGPGLRPRSPVVTGRLLSVTDAVAH